MDLKITYRHLEGTPSLDEKINQKADHLKKYFKGKMEIHWVCTVDNHIHRSEVNILADHTKFYAKAEDDNLYKTFDEVTTKLDHQISKRADAHKDKHVDRHDLNLD